MATEILNCPDQEVLEGFAFGNLASGEISSFESHLSHCSPCLEKIRQFKPTDTIHELTRAAFEISLADQPDLDGEDNATVEKLIERMRSYAHIETRTGAGDTLNEIEGRAAEVQRLLKPSSVESNIGRLAHFEIESILGAGSTGVVYRAINSLLDRVVALKVLRPSLGKAARERFVIEAKSAARIKNPHVVQIYEVGSEDSLAYIAMGWTPGETLEQKLDREQQLSPEQVRLLGHKIANGLAAAHQSGVIHRDIKPANIWIEMPLECNDGHQTANNVTPSDDDQNDKRNSVVDASTIGSVQILDFGLVRVTDANPQLTCTGIIAGTPCFMSPEQSKGGELDERSDFFSLGCLLYRAATGKLPFESNNALATLQSIQREAPQWPHEIEPKIPNDLSALMMCLLEKSPSQRPPSASAISQAIVSKPKQWSFQCEHPKSRRVAGSSNWVRWVAGLTALVMFGFAALFLPQIIRVITDQGELVIKSSDPNVKVEVLEKGKRVVLIDLTTKQTVTIRSGEYELRALSEDNSVEIDKDKIVLKRGGKEIATVTRSENSDVGSAGLNIHQVQVRDIGKLLKNAEAKLNEYETDRRLALQVIQFRSAPWARDALKKDRDRVKTYILNLKQDGKIRITGLGKSAEPYQVLQRYIKELDQQIADLQVVVWGQSELYLQHYAEAKRLANVKREISGVKDQMDHVSKFLQIANQRLIEADNQKVEPKILESLKENKKKGEEELEQLSQQYEEIKQQHEELLKKRSPAHTKTQKLDEPIEGTEKEPEPKSSGVLDDPNSAIDKQEEQNELGTYELKGKVRSAADPNMFLEAELRIYEINGIKNSQQWIATTKSGMDGSFSFKNLKRFSSGADTELLLACKSEGYATRFAQDGIWLWHKDGKLKEIVPSVDFDVKMWGAAEATGQIVDEKDKPIVGAQIHQWCYNGDMLTPN